MTAEPEAKGNRTKSLTGLLAIAAFVGLALMWLDSRPGWDDAGVTAGLVLAASAAFTALWPRLPWLWALAIGMWIPLFGIVTTQNYGSLLALAVAFLGAYLGALMVKVIRLVR